MVIKTSPEQEYAERSEKIAAESRRMREAEEEARDASHKLAFVVIVSLAVILGLAVYMTIKHYNRLHTQNMEQEEFR
jgi:uncharacterized protein HemX